MGVNIMDNTEKQEYTFPFVDGFRPAWSAIVEYTLNHQDDIKEDINDFGTLEPVIEFFNRNVEPFETIDYDFGESIL